MNEEYKGTEEDQVMADGETEEQVLAKKQLAEFTEFLHKARALFNSDPTRVSDDDTR